jgi:hypothetical protein
MIHPEHSTPHSFRRHFMVRQPLVDVTRRLSLALSSRRFVSNPTEHSPRRARFAPDLDVLITVYVLGSNLCQITLDGAPVSTSTQGLLIDAIRSLGRVRESKSPGRTARAPKAFPAVSPKQDVSYDNLLRRLGVQTGIHVGALHGFLLVASDHLVGRLVVPPAVMTQARDCSFLRPEALAEILTDILLIVAKGPQRRSDRETFGHLPGFRGNLSETQLNRYRSDYALWVDGKERVGRLHCTLGSGFSPNTCASIHWVVDGPRLILTRIGAHGRNAQS